jgi:prevent-host-death family protein
MRQATVRDLRNRFARVLTWIEEGERVKVTSRGRVVATLVPERRRMRRVSWPDFLARLRTDWPRGLKGSSVSELIDEGRGDRP